MTDSDTETPWEEVDELDWEEVDELDRWVFDFSCEEGE